MKCRVLTLNLHYHECFLNVIDEEVIYNRFWTLYRNELYIKYVLCIVEILFDDLRRKESSSNTWVVRKSRSDHGKVPS